MCFLSNVRFLLPSILTTMQLCIVLYTSGTQLWVGERQQTGPAASIRFEIWGSWNRVKKFRFLFSGNFTKKKSIFQRKFTKNFDFVQVISQKISVFKGNFRRISIFQAISHKKIGSSWQIFEKF